MLQTRYFFREEFQKFFPIFEKFPHEIVHFQKGEQIKAPTDLFRYNFFIVNGFCKVSVIHDSGEEKVIGYWGNGSIYPIICNEQKFILENSIVVTAMSEMKALRFNTDTTKKIMTQHPEISFEMIDHYCKFTNLLFFCATTQTYEDIKTRVCSMLFIYNYNSGNERFALTQSELASIIGSKRESVVKILKELRNMEIITTSRSHIQILSIEKLEAYASPLLHL